MAGKVKIKELRQAKEWLHGLKHGRDGDHHGRLDHANNIDKVYKKVLAELLEVADDESIDLHTRTTMAGHVHQTNTTDFTVGGRPYTLGYSAGVITIKAGSKFGPVLDTIDNATSMADIEAIFRGL